MPRYTIGVDLGGTNLKAAIFQEHLQSIIEKNVSTEADKGPEHVLLRIQETVTGLIAEAGLAQGEIACMGMGIPGLLDPVRGLSIFSPNFPGWANVSVVREMERCFPFPVSIDNDVRVNLYGEWHCGAGVGYRDLVLLTLGTGLGSGIISDGKVLYGKTASAGEIGHMNMYREGRPCKCGSSGCLGRYVSAVGMVNTALERLQAGQPSILRDWLTDDLHGLTARMISDAYDLGDPTATEVMHETGRLLGYGLANVINLFNPERIIIGGGMAAAGERLLRITRETASAHALQLSSGACEIVQAKLGARAGMIGAAIYARDRLTTQ
jgi:glucokinase